MGELERKVVIGYPVNSSVPNSGAQLPDVTADDNGNVLTVVDGVWDKAEPSGGDGGSATLIVNATYFEDDSGDYPAAGYQTDALWSDILDAYNSGTCVLFKFAERKDGDYVITPAIDALMLGCVVKDRSEVGQPPSINGLDVIISSVINANAFNFNMNTLDASGHLRFNFYLD